MVDEMIIYDLNFAGPYRYDQAFPETFPCVYVIANKTTDNMLYVGITKDINKRLTEHHKLDCWKPHINTNNCLYIYRESEKHIRELIEAQIILLYNPVCNG